MDGSSPAQEAAADRLSVVQGGLRQNDRERCLAVGPGPGRDQSEDIDFPKIEWKGTLKELNDRLCAGGQKKLAEDITAKQAPYKAALKADKLRLVIDEKTGTVYSYALAGGKYTSDAKALAAARVWFLDIGRSTAETRICVNGGKLGSVRRYTFDVNHKLVSTTEKEYCGTPPASAYR